MQIARNSAPAGVRGGHSRSYRPTGRGHAVAPFFLSATLFLLTASTFALIHTAQLPLLTPLTALRWPIIHLALVGGVSQMMLGAMAFFAVTLLRTDAPPAWLMRGQWLLINLGALGLAGGILIGWLPLSVAGGTLVLGALAFLPLMFLYLRRRSLAPLDPTFLYYGAAATCVLIGASLGVSMLLGLTDPLLPRGQVRLAHLHLNLNGWVTLTIIGTMRLFFPTTLGVPARHLNSLWLEFWPLTVGVVLSSAGWLVGSMALFGLGSLLQMIGTFAFGVAIFRQWRAHDGPRPLAAQHLLAGTLWLILLTLGGMVGAGVRPLAPDLAAGLTRAVTTAGFVGFIGQIVLGAWTHLFSVVAALPSGPMPPLTTPLRPRLRAILNGQAIGQVTLANLGVAGLVAGQVIEPLSPTPAAGLSTAGLVALAAVLVLVALKAARVVGTVWQARRDARN